MNTGRSRAYRFYIPTFMALIIFLVLFVTYNNSWYVNNRFLHFLLTDIAGFLYGAVIMAGSVIVYPILYYRGATLLERITGSSVILLAWYTKEIIRMMHVYTFWQSLFYLLMPVQFGVLLVTVIFISLSEIGCRHYAVRTGSLKATKRPIIPVIMLLVSISLVLMVLHQGGQWYFFRFYDMYKLLFM